MNWCYFYFNHSKFSAGYLKKEDERKKKKKTKVGGSSINQKSKEMQ